MSDSPQANWLAALLIGIALIGSVLIYTQLGGETNQRYTVEQTGALFIRFDHRTGELCHVSMFPRQELDGSLKLSYADKYWQCLPGDATQNAVASAEPTEKPAAAELADKPTSTNEQSSSAR